jgi:hypothetical protein
VGYFVGLPLEGAVPLGEDLMDDEDWVDVATEVETLVFVFSVFVFVLVSVMTVVYVVVEVPMTSVMV